jgi:hypothetical protein
MPNWCSNSIEIQGTKEQINKFVSFLDEKNGKDWFDFFLPTPTELKEEGWLCPALYKYFEIAPKEIFMNIAK